jgi:hypothetical protein
MDYPETLATLGIQCHHNHIFVMHYFLFFKEKLLRYEELYLTIEQERKRQEETLDQVTGKYN